MAILQPRGLRFILTGVFLSCILLYNLFSHPSTSNWKDSLVSLQKPGNAEKPEIPDLVAPSGTQTPQPGILDAQPHDLKAAAKAPEAQFEEIKPTETPNKEPNTETERPDATDHPLKEPATHEEHLNPLPVKASPSATKAAPKASKSPTKQARPSNPVKPVKPAKPAKPSKTAEGNECLTFERLQHGKPGPFSEGKRKFPFVRPPPECRTFKLPALDNMIESMKTVIKDQDLFRLFENSYPNTLDTTVKWRGFHNGTDEELSFIITGDIDAMWLRDSASQIYSYLPFLEKSTDSDSLASLWRGLINSHARYIIISPYCHSFQPPPESNLPPTHNGAYTQNNPVPRYDPIKVFDCKWELDSLASFLQISTAYYQKTGDVEFFQKYKWIPAVKAAIDAAGAMRLGTYAPDGKVEKSAWTFTGWTNRGSETLTNDGLGNPSKENGMVRTAFRPSDDATIFQFLVPANMMLAKYLEEASFIMEKLDGAQAKNLTLAMRDFAFGIRKGVDATAVVNHKRFGDVWAYEVDGFGSANMMDDANVPSLLSIPLFDYINSSFPLPNPNTDYEKIYKNTRNFVLSDDNPYFMKGPVISAIGGPHLGPGMAWPMAAIVRGMTALIRSPHAPKAEQKEIFEEVKEQIRMVLDSTAGTGVVHETVNSWRQGHWTRSWFGWANGLFGELIMQAAKYDEKREDGKFLQQTWQEATKQET